MPANPIRRSLHFLLAFVLVLSQLMLLAPSTAVAAPSVTVNSTADGSDWNPGDGVCGTTNGGGPCTLRAAIQEANASGPVDEIHFDIPGAAGATHTIEPLSVLPWITASVSIDATTQNGYSGIPLIVLDGSSAPPVFDGPDAFMVDADDVTIKGFEIRDWHDDGVELHGDGSLVVANYIHRNDEGVLTEDGSNNIVGGLSSDDRNIISGNRVGVSIHDGSGNEVLGNYIGTNQSGTGPLGNDEAGVLIWSWTSDVRIEGNVISGNADHGVHLDNATRVTISSNRIGTNAAATAGVGNDEDGIFVEEADQVWVGPDNVISGNGHDNQDHGVHLEEDAHDVEVFGNRIGTDGSGASAIPNAQDGVHADADDVLIEDNQVSGNGQDGLRLEQEGAVVRGNLIGTNSAGTGPVPNGDDGIDTGSGTTGSDIGGTAPGDGNVIAFNGDAGISLRHHAGTQAAIVSNSIFDNGGLGIDLLGDGVTANDYSPTIDHDSGPNDLLNYPEITVAEEAEGTVYVEFDLPVPNGHYRVEFFLNPSGPDPSGHGEGEAFVAAVEVYKTGATGSFSHTFPGAVGGELTATATRCEGSCPGFRMTSEFSASRTITPGNHAPVLDPIANVVADEETLITFTATATDADDDDLTFDLIAPVPAGASIDSDTGVFTWTPTEDQGFGSYPVGIRVTDDGELSNGSPRPLSDTQTITITVNETNRPPVLTDPGDHTIPEHSPFTFTATATDPDLPANTLTYGLDDGLGNVPNGASINPNTGVFTWTPSENQGPFAYFFDVTVTDGTITVTETVNISVTEVNEPPALTNPGDQSDAEADTIDLTITATDPDQPANTLTYAAAGLPPGLNINPNTGQITGTITYAAAATSPHNVTITVTDNGTPHRNDTANFTWVTDNTNRAPNLDPITNKTTNEQTTLNFTVTATDPDPGTTLTYSLSGAPNGATINPNTGVFTWTPTESQSPNTYTLDIQVTDNDPTTPLTDTQTITITVNETNRAPVAGDDTATTSEDTPVTIPVLANDSDEDIPLNRLRVSGVSNPAPGGSVNVTAGGIVYSPPANFHGSAVFNYTLFDGIATDTATVTVVVTPVNDVPVARDDEFRLTTYQPAELDVLANDTDADGEPLGITLKGTIPNGLTLAGNTVTFDPISGWTGSVVFEYVVHDPNGASSSATVEVIVGNEVLLGAQRLADDLGVDLLPFNPPAPSFEPQGLSLIDLDGITLLADSFFQTVDALRIPLGFLGVTVAMVVGLGATSDVPALVFGARRRHWAVVRLGRQQRLPAYSEPGGRKVVYNYDPTAAAIVSIGRSRAVGNTEWLPVESPNGKAWIYRQYLTEHVDLQAFSEDSRPVRLVHELATRLREGKSIHSLISDEGLVLALTGSPSQIAPDELAALMGDRRLRHLPGSGFALTTPEEFTLAVARPFLEAYEATPEVTAATPHSRSALIPTECWNFPYLAIGPANGVQPWLVFFEYRNGKAFIAGLGIDE